MSQDQEIRLDTVPEPVFVDGDERRLQQVILNLVSNALLHGPSDRGVAVRVRRGEREAVMEVIDYGPGILAEDREKVFERFYQAGDGTRRGLGVGLYLVHAIVTAHDGRIDVQPNDPRGARFVVLLPLAE
jgi:signal transduction histidine kinase